MRVDHLDLPQPVDRAAAPLLPAVPAGAAAPAADRQAPSFYRYKVGDIMVSVVSDGKNVFKLKLQAFVLGSVIGGIAGIIFMFDGGFVKPDFFVSQTTFNWYLIVILGGGSVSTLEVEIWVRATRLFDLSGAAVLAGIQVPARELAREFGKAGLLGMHLQGYGCAGTTATMPPKPPTRNFRPLRSATDLISLRYQPPIWAPVLPIGKLTML